jgi:integrase
MEDIRLVAHRDKWAFRYEGQRYSTGLGATPENKDAAQRKAGKILQALIYEPQNETVAAIMASYLAEKDDDPRCIDSDRLRYAWKALEGHFAGLLPDEIDRRKCRAYHKARANYANGTINKELRTLRAGLTWHLGSKDNPSIFEFLPEDEPRDRHLSRAEFYRLEEAASSPHLKLFLHLAIATAARKAALLELTWMQIRWDQNAIFLGKKPNGKKRATVPMTKRLRKELEAAKEAAECSHVIEYAGEPVGKINKAFNRACRKAGISDFTIHDLRHTAAVWMIGDGVLMEKVSNYLGHTRIDITRNIYAKYQPDHLQDAAAALEV